MAQAAPGPFASTAAVVANCPARRRQKTETPCSSYWPRLPASPRDDVETGKLISHRPATLKMQPMEKLPVSLGSISLFPSH